MIIPYRERDLPREYGWRAVGMRISPFDEGAGVGEASLARLTVPGCGTAPLPMRFPKRTR